MSHVFEALRRSEGHAGNGEFPLAPDAFFEAIEDAPELTSVASVQAALKPESRLVIWDQPGTLAADRYRLLCIQLEKLQGAGKLRTLLITSAAAQDGKSTVTLNLAAVFAAKGKHKVLIIEADLRRPVLLERLGLTKWDGVSACLAEGLDPISAMRRIEPMGFYLLPAGEPVPNPTELLQSERLTRLVQSMSGRFDWILMDSPPTSPIADALTLKPRADAGLLVARSGKTQSEAIEESMRQLGQGFVMGVVLNGVEGLDREYSEYYSKYTLQVSQGAKK